MGAPLALRPARAIPTTAPTQDQRRFLFLGVTWGAGAALAPAPGPRLATEMGCREGLGRETFSAPWMT